MPLVPETNYPDLGSAEVLSQDDYGLRESCGRLSEVFDQATQPLVIAVDGAWGSGKTYFLRAWTGVHGIEKARVIYFDAFVRDYLDDPLVSLVAALEAETLAHNLGNLGQTKEALETLTHETAVLAGIPMGAVMQRLKPAPKADAFWDAAKAREGAVERIKGALRSMLEITEGPEKLVIIVDELDRCRPDYALRMLEVIKHFFAVDGVHFVLGVNLEQLAQSVRAVYGSGFDAERYLQRFVPLVMEIHGNKSERYPHENCVRYLKDLSQENNWLAYVIEGVQPNYPLTFRDMERLHTLGQVCKEPRGIPALANIQAMLMILKVVAPTVYARVSMGGATMADIRRVFSLPNFATNSEAGQAMFGFAMLLKETEGMRVEIENYEAVRGVFSTELPTLLGRVSAFKVR